MHFLRFGSSIPGPYWGCCAVDIIQQFDVDPDKPASIQLVGGDSGTPITQSGQMLFAGPTYRDIFWQRIRCGTFDNVEMPNHGFIAIVTGDQLGEGYCDDDEDYDSGYESNSHKWLKILKEAGFEFIRSVSNSVYTGQTLAESFKEAGRGHNRNYIFGLFRNIGDQGDCDPLTPPDAWLELPSPAGMTEVYEQLTATDRARIAAEQFAAHRLIWETNKPGPFLKMSELEAQNVPIWLAGERSKYPQELKSTRDGKKAKEKEVSQQKASAFPSSLAKVA